MEIKPVVGISAIVLLLVSFSAMAGPVGQYLGLAPGLKFNLSHSRTDSVHIYYPTELDSVMHTTWHDTTTVLAETLYQGLPAWLLRRTGEDGSSTVDTLVEQGDSLMKLRVKLGDSLRWNNRYLVPFSVGQWWRTGLAGTYYLDLNGDGLEDTLQVWGDTTRVVGVETVTVPYGTVEEAYKLRTVARQWFRLKESGMSIRCTTRIVGYEWYKDSLGLVKYTTSLEGVAYARVVVWLHFADIYSEGVGELTDFATGSSEPPSVAPVITGRVTNRPNPFRDKTVIITDAPASRVDIYDSSGRQVQRLATGPDGMAIWDGRDARGQVLPEGVYLVRTPVGTSPVTKMGR